VDDQIRKFITPAALSFSNGVVDGKVPLRDKLRTLWYIAGNSTLTAPEFATTRTHDTYTQLPKHLLKFLASELIETLSEPNLHPECGLVRRHKLRTSCVMHLHRRVFYLIRGASPLNANSIPSVFSFEHDFITGTSVEGCGASARPRAISRVIFTNNE
jgi:hypothetical protein